MKRPLKIPLSNAFIILIFEVIFLLKALSRKIFILNLCVLSINRKNLRTLIADRIKMKSGIIMQKICKGYFIGFLSYTSFGFVRNSKPCAASSPPPSASPSLSTLAPALPESIAVKVRREGTEEEITAYKTLGTGGVVIYLFPEFMLTQDEGFDIIIPKPDSGYLPVSLTIERNKKSLSPDEALERAKSFYPNVSFEETSFPYELLGNLEEVKAAWGKLGDDWVIAVGMTGEKGSVSAWGQGAAETAEGLQVLLLSQLSTIVLE